MDEKISKLFLPLLDKLYNTEPAGEPFRKPVDVVKYGCFDYYLYVKHPIDLSTIRQRLTSHQYKDAWRFVADIQLMFANAYLFNKKGTPVYEFTNKLNKIWTSDSSPIMQRLNYCCGTLHKFGPQLLFCHGTTPDRYCQITIGAKYKCYQDQYSFCMPCFNKIESDHINIQGLSCETTRMKLPTQPVKKSDFIDCANDKWQYESFVQCTQCSRRVHNICELYPGEDYEAEKCKQHAEIEEEQKMLCQVPEEYRTSEDTTDITTSSAETLKNETDEVSSNQDSSSIVTLSETITEQPQEDQLLQRTKNKLSLGRGDENVTCNVKPERKEVVASSTSLDDELLQFARDLDEDFANSAPTSPNPEEVKTRIESAKDSNSCHKKVTTCSSIGERLMNNSSRNTSNYQNASAKNSVDNIAARLSINKMSAESQTDEVQKQKDITLCTPSSDKFVCNHCYRKQKIGFNLRHRKYSARRLPHTRMSRYIETKVNEHIRENSPTAGEVTIRVLTAYRDTISVKPEMRDYVQRSRLKELRSQTHPNAKDYPHEFGYTNRAIFAWQEIDGVDVCVFGMHVQEYGEDCPEPNRQVIYLSYLDSVHFFRPKQVRTAVYHEILLSYFKYVKKLGFKRVFIWVCPSRKGDDYIFYRHPSEQKMPTLKRLSDWYVNLLDKGVKAGIVESHQNIYQFAGPQPSVLSMPYLSGDYWPGEFERLLNIMIESQKEYETKLMLQEKRDTDSVKPLEILDADDCIKPYNNNYNSPIADRSNESSLLALTNIFQKPPNSTNSKTFNTKNPYLSSLGLKPTKRPPSTCNTPDDYCSIPIPDESKYYDAFTPDSSRSEDQPLDLSKSSSNTSPESCYDEDLMFEDSYKSSNNKKKRRKSNTSGYIKAKRCKTFQSANTLGATKTNRQNQSLTCEGSSKFRSQPTKSCRQKQTPYALRDPLSTETLMHPEDELMKNLERSLKRQKEGFIVARLNECDCSPHFESQRRKEEATFTCDLMKGREPFLQLARLKNYEFSTLRRAKFSSLAMVKHLGHFFKLDPICNECYSFDSSKRHYACSHCSDYYLCTSCHENTPHEHIMSLMAPTALPDIDEFLQQCSLASSTNSISSASSTISNKSFNENTLDVTPQAISPTLAKDASTTSSTPLNRHLSNTRGVTSNMPLSCYRQKNLRYGPDSRTRIEDEENADICTFETMNKLNIPNQPSPPPSHSASNIRSGNSVGVELDQVLVENFIRHAEVSYDIDFDQMKGESKKLLAHYWACPIKDTCHRCKFVVLSCSFMSVLMRSTRLQMMINCNPSDILPSNNTNNNHHSGINLTTAHRLSYQPKDKS